MTPKHPSSLSPSLVLLLVAWELFGGLYILRMSPGALSHDYPHHLLYTQIVYGQHRLPLPYEGLETYQPPLYYLINAGLGVRNPHHPFWARLLCLQFGLIALALTAWQLERLETTPILQAIILAFIMTSPSFLFIFANYNNDSLATLLSMVILIMTWEMMRRPRNSLAISLCLVMTAALYTKLSVLYAIGAGAVLIITAALRRRISRRLAAQWLTAAVVAGALLLPWMIGHNFIRSGHLLPAPADNVIAGFTGARLPQNPIRTLLMPLGVHPGEWGDPFTHAWGPDPKTKKYSFTAYLFSTWVFDEYEFLYLPALVLWLIVLAHAWAALSGGSQARYTETGRSALLVIAMGILLFSSLMFRYPYASLMHFRYIAWVWLPLAIVWAEGARRLNSEVARWMAGSLKASLVLGTILHIALWFPLVHQAARWYY